MMTLDEIIELLTKQADEDRPHWEQVLLSNLADKAELWKLSFGEEQADSSE